jgi:hypothetical protein
MIRLIATLAMLLTQTVCVCGPGALVLCVHPDGASHVELAARKCCELVAHHQASQASGHHCQGHHDHAVTTHAAAGAVVPCEERPTADNPCDSCTDYPLVVDQLHASGSPSLGLFADLTPALGSIADHRSSIATLLRSTASRVDACSDDNPLAALATVMLRC